MASPVQQAPPLKLITRVYRVEPEQLARALGYSRGVITNQYDLGKMPPPRPEVQETFRGFLEAMGINTSSPNGAFMNDRLALLMVRARENEIMVVERIVEIFNDSDPLPVAEPEAASRKPQGDPSFTDLQLAYERARKRHSEIARLYGDAHPLVLYSATRVARLDERLDRLKANNWPSSDALTLLRTNLWILNDEALVPIRAAERLSLAATNRPHATLMIKAEPPVRWKEVVLALDMARKAGFQAVTIASFQESAGR